ncbi:MAG TPA: DUF6714 family protein [Actinomycetota bacterium]|nr:DUF6714 family protein [Actinomycetota bacterium]
MASLEDVLHQIGEAFADAPRPPDAELLHESCADDNDIASLYGIPHWREVPDAVVEQEYAALFFLSPAGFRHFLPASMSFALRNRHSAAAAVGSTVYALTPGEGNLRAFSVSKFDLFDEAQRAAVVAFLEAMVGSEDVTQALEHWRAGLGLPSA